MIDTETERYFMENETQKAYDFLTNVDEKTPNRPLDSLTDDEAKTVFHIAFRVPEVAIPYLYIRSTNLVHRGKLERVEIETDTHNLAIFRNGDMKAYGNNISDGHIPIRFNARKVLIYLALLGIQFDEP